MEAISTTQQKQCIQKRKNNHTYGGTIEINRKKQLHYTALGQNTQKRKGISSCCRKSQSQQVQHTLTGHLATINTEHRKNMTRLLQE